MSKLRENMKIMMVDINLKYLKTVSKKTTESGMNIEVFDNPLDALLMFSVGGYGVVIVDVDLGDITGIQFIATIKKYNPNVKTIILSKKKSAEYELEALNLNVDKYLTKDVRIDILLKYIEQIVGSATRIVRPEFLQSKVEGLELSLKSREVLKNGEPIYLTRKEFEILYVFLLRKNEAIAREEFIEHVWTQPAEDIYVRVIDVHIKTLRKKIQCQSILSIRGFGYKWVE